MLLLVSIGLLAILSLIPALASQRQAVATQVNTSYQSYKVRYDISKWFL